MLIRRAMRQGVRFGLRPVFSSRVPLLVQRSYIALAATAFPRAAGTQDVEHYLGGVLSRRMIPASAPGGMAVMYLHGGGYVLGGDSDVISDSFGSKLDGKNIVYFDGADLNDPLVAPITDNKLLSRFPHTLIINSTRDFTLSPALVTHQRLLSAGVESELHVYEGLNHYFFADTELPESRHAFNVISRFFNQHLGGSQTTATAFVQCQ